MKSLILTSLLLFGQAQASEVCEKLFVDAQKADSGALIDFAIETESQAYVYPSHGDRYLPVMALQKSDLSSYLDEFGDDTISFIYRSDSWHSYVRVGRLFIDLEVLVYDNDEMKRSVRMRNAESVFRKSKSTEWKEGILKLDKKTIQMMQWFFLYRSEYFKLKDYKGQLTDDSWDMKFCERPRNYDEQESCAMFNHSPMVSLFYKNLPSAAIQKKLRTNVTKSAKRKLAFAVKGEAPTMAAVVKHMKSAFKKYGFDQFPSSKIKSQQGQLRLVNVHPNAVGYVLHNQDYQDFIRLNKMGFVPRTQTSDPINQPFDTKIRERISIEEF